MNLPIHNNLLKVKVIPNAAATEIREITSDIVKIAVAAPPDKNKANQELIHFLKKEYRINVRIKSGATSRNKTLEIQ